jgi:Holliday junction DNA helicase RuvA
MIGSLRGVVLERSSDSTVLIEVNGVGYLVIVTPRTLAELEPTSQAFLHVHHHVREDAQTLYGFRERTELLAFEALLSAHGVGPTMAMAVLATHSPHVLADIVATSDIAALTMVPGVGKKTAERLMIELKGKMNLPVLDGIEQAGAVTVLGDVRDALIGLGYTADEVRLVMREIGPVESPADALRAALAMLGARRA